MNYEFYFLKDNKEYLVVVTYKRIQNIIFRFRDEVFYVSAPHKTPNSLIHQYLSKHCEKLLRSERKALNPFVGDQMYLLGKLVTLKEGYIIKQDFLQDNLFYYLDEEDLEKKLKKIALEHFTKRVRYFEKELKIKKAYNIRIRKMTSRYASNSSKTHSLTFQLNLIHFESQLSDAIIIHELAHDSHFHHQPSFYEKVLKYCPDYYEKIQKIKDGEFIYDN